MTGFTWKLVPDAELAAVFADIVNRLTALQDQLNVLEQKMATTDEAIAALTQAVTDQGTVIESAVTLLSGLSAMLEAAKDDPAQIQAVIDQVNQQKDALASAVQANTPQTPTP